MLFKSVYRFKVRIQDRAIAFPLHLCSYKDKAPLFDQLVDKINNVVKDVNMNDYYITDDRKRSLLHDDNTLWDALRLVSDHQILEIVLCRKQPPTPCPQRSSVPVIKPTVLRWTPPVRRYSADNDYEKTEEEQYAIRKDSGISLTDDEEPRKKQRILSDATRKLPELHPSHRPREGIHPLDSRRASVISNSSTSNPITITLPAISSITSTTEPIDSHLAPIQSRSSPCPSFSGLPSTNHGSRKQSLAPMRTSLSIVVPTTTTHSLITCSRTPNSLPVIKTASPSSSSSSSRTSSSSTTLSGQFLCEHVVDRATGRICGQTFRRSYDLSRHQTIHLKNRPFCYCSQCGKKFTRMDALRRHERVQGHAPKQPHLSSQRPSASLYNASLLNCTTTQQTRV
ncbi:uncharacterized protein BYT42DRAFT_643038 [Radiomyces spectabilis]|uniref:uncharacterized protein n=1 Tax=Radiomyces spectabilis TaxID=64574 RepID=UPI00221F0EA6|nr:uncharacterized protein BYT42DRAFT_643038 [Radiomyces spectabilis]KAI8388902.1 hypothetical protein BYT42DRAFT_643038 [Radiomyces spectabilis]